MLRNVWVSRNGKTDIAYIYITNNIISFIVRVTERIFKVCRARTANDFFKTILNV